MEQKVYDEPSTVESEEGQVFVDGPDGVAVSLTPEAAEETGERLIDNAVDAAAFRRRSESAKSAAGDGSSGDGPD